MRNLILVRLSQIGCMVRNFISNDGKSIFSVIYFSEQNLKTQAERSKILKVLNTEFTDLLSLEPCDPCFRPLRLNNRLWRPRDYVLHLEISEYFLYLRPKLVQLIEEINFLRMGKEVNIQGLNE